MATRISMVAKKLPLHMRSRVVGGAIRPFSFSSIENTNKKPTLVDSDYGSDLRRIATQIDYIAQRVQKIDQQLSQLQWHLPPQKQENSFKQWKGTDGDRERDAFYGPNFNYKDPQYHDPKLPEFSAIAKRALDTHNLSQVTKLELVKVVKAFTDRGEDNTHILIEAKPCNSATDSDSQPEVIYKGVILSKDEKFMEPPRRQEIPLNPFKQWKGTGGDRECVAFYGPNFNYVPPQYHDPNLPEFSAIAKRALDTYNLSQVTKLELVEVVKAFTKNGGDNTHILIKAKPCNPATDSDSQPEVIYEGVILCKDEKFVRLVPIEPAKNLDQTKEIPVDHDLFAPIAQQAIHSYNLDQHNRDSKLELIKVTSFTNHGDKPCLVIKARTCSTPDSQPVLYKGLVLLWEEILEKLIPMEPGEFKL